MPNTIKLEFDVAQIKQLESLATKFKSGSGNGEDLLNAKKLTEERKKQIALTEEEKVKNQQLTREKRLQAQIAVAQEGSYNKIAATVNLMTLKAKENNEYWKANAATINNLKDQLKALDAEIGNHQRNVGNYAGAIKQSFAQIGITIAGITAAYMAANRVIGGSIKAALEAERAESRLNTALGDRNKILPNLIKQSKELQRATGIRDEDIQSAQELFAVQGRTEEQIIKSTHAAVEYAKVFNVDVRTAAEQVDATFEGNIGRLARKDEGFKKLSLTELQNGAAIDLINNKYGDFAETMDDSQTRIDKASAAWDDMKEVFGGFLLTLTGPLISEATASLSTLTDMLGDKNISGWKKFGALIESIFSQMPVSVSAVNYEVDKAINSTSKKIDEANKEQKKQTKELTKEQLAEIERLNKEKEDFEKDYYKYTHQARANEIRELTLDYNDKIAKAIKYGKDIVVLQEQLRLKILEINKKYDEQDAEQLKKAQKEKYDSMTAPEGSSTKNLEAEAEKQRQKENRDIAHTAEEQAEIEKKKYEKISGYIKEYSSYASEVISGLGGLFEAEKQREIDAAGNNQARITQIEREYAQKQKQIAIAQAFIKYALAQASILPEILNTPKFLLDEAIITAQFGLALATINAQKFAKGVIDLSGGIEGKDSILSLLTPHESVMTADETKKHKPALQAIRENIFDEYIRVNYVIPELTKKANDDINKTTARNMYDGLKLKAELDDYELRRKLNKLDQTNFYLQSIDNKLNKSNIIR